MLQLAKGGRKRHQLRLLHNPSRRPLPGSVSSLDCLIRETPVLDCLHFPGPGFMTPSCPRGHIPKSSVLPGSISRSKCCPLCSVWIAYRCQGPHKYRVLVAFYPSCNDTEIPSEGAFYRAPTWSTSSRPCRQAFPLTPSSRPYGTEPSRARNYRYPFDTHIMVQDLATITSPHPV